jgi:predicted XRE-type DNA-binding protein
MNITRGSGNVFEDAGFSPEEAADLLLKTDLAIDLRSFILHRGWTHEQASIYFGEPISQIDRLLDLDIRCFSIERLRQLTYLAAGQKDGARRRE